MTSKTTKTLTGGPLSGKRRSLRQENAIADSPSENVSAHPSGKSPEQLRKDRVWLWTRIPAFLLFIAIILVGPWVITTYDKNHWVAIECTVTGAEGERSSGSSRGSAPRDQVIIQTSDCGRLRLDEGIDESNRDAVAAELVEGRTFSFEVGEATQNLRWLRLTPTVWTYQKIG